MCKCCMTCNVTFIPNSRSSSDLNENRRTIEKTSASYAPYFLTSNVRVAQLAPSAAELSDHIAECCNPRTLCTAISIMAIVRADITLLQNQNRQNSEALPVHFTTRSIHGVYMTMRIRNNTSCDSRG